MDKVARLAAQDRQDIFSETAAKLGISPTIIEKDFWVCIVLKLLFLKSPFGKSLVFKGGTSLSKAHGLIKRFSEDIDLVLDWQLIGFGAGLKDPMQNFGSKSKQDQFNKEINRLAADFIAKILCPKLNGLLRKEGIGLSASVDPTDPHVINIHYPAAFSETYIRPEVRLEIGPLASWVPSARRTIRPYASDSLPQVFENPACEVVAITAERTFWEKATILIRKRTGKRRSRNAIPATTMTFTNWLSVILEPLPWLRSGCCKTWWSSKDGSIPLPGPAMTLPFQARSSCYP